MKMRTLLDWTLFETTLDLSQVLHNKIIAGIAMPCSASDIRLSVLEARGHLCGVISCQGKTPFSCINFLLHFVFLSLYLIYSRV
jgi:hypothetical protein